MNISDIAGIGQNVPNPSSTCLELDKIMPWCQGQHFQHDYLYVPLLAMSFLFMALDSMIEYLGIGDKVIYEISGGKIITWNYVRGMLMRGAKFFLFAFLLIFMAQNGLWPFSWLPDSWNEAINGLLRG